MLPAVGADFTAAGGPALRFSFDASSRLARQIDAGAPADLFFSADPVWADHLAQGGRLAGSPTPLLRNRLALVVPADAAFVPASPAALLSPALRHLALAGASVPAGRYARAALAAAGVQARLADRVVEGDDVRTTLAWVARGEAEAGVVYATDARIEPRVRVAFTFDEASHPPIVYPAAVVAGPRAAQAAAFLRWCRTAPARARFEAAGFGTLQETASADGAAGQPGL